MHGWLLKTITKECLPMKKFLTMLLALVMVLSLAA